MDVQPKPDGVEIPEDETWESLTPFQRWYYKNHEDAKERYRDQRDRKREWFQNLKEGLECRECGEGHPATLDFHHPDEKHEGVANMVNQNRGYDAIREEIERCVVLCANCHRKLHAEG